MSTQRSKNTGKCQKKFHRIRKFLGSRNTRYVAWTGTINLSHAFAVLLFFYPKGLMALSKNWQLSAFEYYVEFLVIPVLVGLATWLGPIILWQFGVGILVWSLAEYCMHRFLFHRTFRRDHWAHHVDSRAYIGISGVYASAAYALAILPAWWLKLQSVYAGFLLGYFSYMTLHYAIHRPRPWFGRIVGHLVRNHEMHHRKGIEKNFGVTSPLWDVIFLSYVHPITAAVGQERNS